MFQGEVLLITGGTGSFGNAVLRAFLQSNIAEIRIFSRDEKKQDDQRKFYRSNKLKYYVGDVRDYTSVLNATRGVDYIFHAAALKQVPSCEFHPMEAVKTNVNRDRKRARGCHHEWRAPCRMSEHRQGSLSDQCNGHLQGHDGEGHGREVPQVSTRREP